MASSASACSANRTNPNPRLRWESRSLTTTYGGQLWKTLRRRQGTNRFFNCSVGSKTLTQCLVGGMPGKPAASHRQVNIISLSVDCGTAYPMKSFAMLMELIGETEKQRNSRESKMSCHRQSATPFYLSVGWMEKLQGTKRSLTYGFTLPLRKLVFEGGIYQ